MPRFFLTENLIERYEREADGILGRIVIENSDARHIAFSLRMRVGDAVTVCDMRKTEYCCRIASITRTREGRDGDVQVLLDILEMHPTETEPSFEAWLYQALPKGDKFDTIVQKAVETGVTGIVPFLSERCISRPDPAACARKCERWRKIAEEAAKQCGRGIIPEVHAPVTYEEAVAMAAASGTGFLCYEGDGTLPLGQLLGAHHSGEPLHFLIGAEGGFSVSEAEYAASCGLALVGLGRRILRCETASGFVLSCMTYAYDLQ